MLSRVKVRLPNEAEGGQARRWTRIHFACACASASATSPPIIRRRLASHQPVTYHASSASPTLVPTHDFCGIGVALRCVGLVSE
jgi:hypothetical protein